MSKRFFVTAMRRGREVFKTAIPACPLGQAQMDSSRRFAISFDFPQKRMFGLLSDQSL